MYKLNYTKRVWLVKQHLKGASSSKIALAQGVTRMTISNLISQYNQFGWDGLKDHKTGRPETTLNPKVEDMILELRKKHEYGACHIEQILKRKGFSISHRQIEKLLLRNNLVKPNLRKQRSRKWVRYELPNPNDLWHTDWTYDPFTGKQLSVYIDDRTRLITSYGIFKKAITQYSIALLKTGIANYGKPKTVMTDHGSQFYANYPNAKQDKTEFRKVLNILSIKHYLARVNRPQTNGKVERFFLTYKTGYATGTFDSIKDFMKYYNEERLHMSLRYRTPKEIWDELKNVPQFRDVN